MKTLQEIESEITAHQAGCIGCSADPAIGCSILIALREDYATVLKIRRLQYADEVRARAEANNPNWFRGSREGPFLTSFEKINF